MGVEIAMTVDDDATPHSIDLEVRGRERPSHQRVQLLDLGAELSVDLPGEAERDPTPAVAEEDLACFAHPAPLGLAGTLETVVPFDPSAVPQPIDGLG